MNDAITIEQELEFLAAQVGTGDIPAIQKLSPAQMAALASGLGRKHGIKIEFGDVQTAATDGKSIVLPLTCKERSWIVRGFLDHETAHLRLTDFSNIPNSSAFRRSLWNIIEDVRIEARMPLFYPGMASNFRALIRELRKTTPDILRVKPDSPPDMVIAAYISLVLRAMYLRQAEVADLAIETREIFISMFGIQLEADLYRLISKIDQVDTPQDVVDLVDEIIELLEEQAQQEEDGTDTSQAEQGADDNGGQAQDSGAQHRQDSESSAAASGDDTQPQPGDASNPVSLPDNPDLTPAKPVREALESTTEQGGLGEQLKDMLESNTSLDDGHAEIASAAKHADLLATGYRQQSITAHSGLVARLSSRLRGLLQAQDLQSATPGTTGNRIARNRLHRIRIGDPKLFLRKSPEKMVNTAIHLLIDNSASMDDNQRFHVTKEVTLALVKSLEHMRGVNLAVTVFPAYYPYNRSIGSTSIPVAPLLSHGNKPGRKMFYPGAPKGQTPLHAAVRFAASEMLSLPEPRKVLIVLTDGEPDCTEDAEDSVQEAAGLGIEVLALGIEQLAFPDIFPHFEVVRAVEDLPEKTFSLLERLLNRN